MEKSLKKARNSDHTKYIYFPKKLFYIIIITIIITIIMWSVHFGLKILYKPAKIVNVK